MLFRQKLKFHVAQFGRLDRAAVENAVGLAQLVQNAFEFDFLPNKITFPAESYRLSNSGYDLDRAVAEVVVPTGLPRPLILFTSLPYGDGERPDEPDCFYFSEQFDSIFLVSTYWWETLQPTVALQAYILMMICSAVLGHLTELEYHADETSGCLFDYCENVRDVVNTFNGSGLCMRCEQALMRQRNAGVVNSFQIAATTRIFDRAKGTRRCFIAMPFSPLFSRVHDCVTRSISAAGWLALRADEIIRPRDLTDAIFEAILTSDLVVADITRSNPNVFYELGFAKAAGCDIIMLCQKSSRRLPIDISHERTVFYTTTDDGMKILEDELRSMALRA